MRETSVREPDKGTVPESLVAVTADTVISHHKMRTGKLDPRLSNLERDKEHVNETQKFFSMQTSFQVSNNNCVISGEK